MIKLCYDTLYKIQLSKNSGSLCKIQSLGVGQRFTEWQTI